MSWIFVDHFSAETMRSGCLMCGNGEVRQGPDGPELILSTQYNDEFAGTPEFCATCIGEAAAMIGWKSGSAYAKEVQKREAAEAELVELKKQLEDKSAAVRTLTSELSSVLAEPPKRTKVGAK